MSGIERCPHCFAPLAAYTNGFGGAYLQCLDCGYYEGIRRQCDPNPSREVTYVGADGFRRTRYRPPRRQFKVPRKSLATEDGLAMLRAVGESLGRAPTVRELASPDCPCPTQSWFRSRFGSLGEAIRAAGLTPNRVGNPTGRNGQNEEAA